MKYALKARYGTEIYANCKIKRFFGINDSEVKTMKLKYQDRANEWVTLANDDDMEYALENAPNGLLDVTVFLNGKRQFAPSEMASQPPEPPESKRARFSTEEPSAADQEPIFFPPSHLSESQSRFSHLPNELIYAVCCTIPAMMRWEKFLFTSFIMHTYLGPRFRRKLMKIYGDAIVFIRKKLDESKQIAIRIDRVATHDERVHVVVFNQEQSNERFELDTNHLRIGMEQKHDPFFPRVFCWIHDDQFESAQVHCFLRTIAPLIRPIKLDLYCISKRKTTAGLMRLLSTQSGCIDSVELTVAQFNLLCGLLAKNAKLEVFGSLEELNLPNFIQWLTSHNDGNPKKWVFVCLIALDEALTHFLEEIKQHFSLATSQRRFVVHFGLCEPLDKFTLGNEATREKLELRCVDDRNEEFFYALSRFPIAEMDRNEKEFMDFSSSEMAQIYLK